MLKTRDSNCASAIRRRRRRTVNTRTRGPHNWEPTGDGMHVCACVYTVTTPPPHTHTHTLLSRLRLPDAPPPRANRTMPGGGREDAGRLTFLPWHFFILASVGLFFHRPSSCPRVLVFKVVERFPRTTIRSWRVLMAHFTVPLFIFFNPFFSFYQSISFFFFFR